MLGMCKGWKGIKRGKDLLLTCPKDPVMLRGRKESLKSWLFSSLFLASFICIELNACKILKPSSLHYYVVECKNAWQTHTHTHWLTSFSHLSSATCLLFLIKWGVWWLQGWQVYISYLFQFTDEQWCSPPHCILSPNQLLGVFQEVDKYILIPAPHFLRLQ